MGCTASTAGAVIVSKTGPRPPTKSSCRSKRSTKGELKAAKALARDWNRTAIDLFRSQVASDVLGEHGSKIAALVSPFCLPTSRQVDPIGEQPVQGPCVPTQIEVPLVYCDQTASNRAVKSIEQYMERVCLPFHANTHTTSSATGEQTMAFVAETRRILLEHANAVPKQYLALFAGSGATSAVQLLIDCIGLHQRVQTSRCLLEMPVVFVGPYEHHSNILPWREAGCEVIMVPESDQSRTVDYRALENLLADPKHRDRFKIGTFSAASNITGKVSDVDRLAALLHDHGALAFFDYATAAPYLKIDMSKGEKDAVFFSPHKMLGGVGTSGVLIVKQSLVRIDKPPARPGGGTVAYVTSVSHRYLSDPTERYEGGTPNVAGIMRVGLVFLLKDQVEQGYHEAWSKMKQSEKALLPQSIHEFEFATYRFVASYLKEHAPNLVLLGSEEGGNNLPIFSFLIFFQNRFLPYGFVCELLNDLFGIQSRGGCSCAGPYGQRLLGLTTTSPTTGIEVPNDANVKFDQFVEKFEYLGGFVKSGFTRISLPFKGLHPEEVVYVVKALAWVANHGWALLCNYSGDLFTGRWQHKKYISEPKTLRSLLPYKIGGEPPVFDQPKRAKPSDMAAFLEATLANADRILAAAKTDFETIRKALVDENPADLIGKEAAGEIKELQWFVYPSQVARTLLDSSAREAKSTSESINGLEGPMNPYVRFSESVFSLKSKGAIIFRTDIEEETASDSFNPIQ